MFVIANIVIVADKGSAGITTIATAPVAVIIAATDEEENDRGGGGERGEGALRGHAPTYLATRSMSCAVMPSSIASATG